MLPCTDTGAGLTSQPCCSRTPASFRNPRRGWSWRLSLATAHSDVPLCPKLPAGSHPSTRPLMALRIPSEPGETVPPVLCPSLPALRTPSFPRHLSSGPPCESLSPACPKQPLTMLISRPSVLLELMRQSQKSRPDPSENPNVPRTWPGRAGDHGFLGRTGFRPHTHLTKCLGAPQTGLSPDDQQNETARCRWNGSIFLVCHRGHRAQHKFFRANEKRRFR